MIKITTRQAASLSCQAATEFLDRVVSFVQEHFPDAARTDAAELRAELVPVLKKGHAYGLGTERELISFLLAAKEFGSDFDQHRAVQSALTAQTSPAEKASLLDCLFLLQSTEAHPRKRAG